jgi:NDP-sugar pyrophosphorylase family protein
MKRAIHAGDVTAVILAGGHGTRLYGNNPLLSKPLLPIGRQSIVGRLAEQVHRAGLSRTIVFAAPETASWYAQALLRPSSSTNVQLTSSSAYRKGPVHALISLREQIPTCICLLLLGDIVYTQSPLKHGLPRCLDRTIWLGTRARSIAIDYGFVYTERGVYRLEDRPRHPVIGGLQWSGLCFFPTELLDFACPSPRSYRTLGDFFDRSRHRYPIAPFRVPDFVNVNTSTDYLIAQLLTFGDDDKIRPEHTNILKAVRSLTRRLRADRCGTRGMT